MMPQTLLAEDAIGERETSPILARFEEEVLAQKFLQQLAGPFALKRLPPITMSDLHRRGLELTGARRFNEAIKIYEEIVISNQNDDEAYMILGHLYLMAHRYTNAEDAFWNAVQIDSANQQDIVPFYQNMIVQSPDNDTAHALLGYAHLILGDVQGSVESFQDALEINPLNEEALKGLNTIQKRFG